MDPELDFHVAIDGAPQALSLDDLAALYEADSIDDATLIWQEGFSDWMRLDALLAALSEQDQGGEATAGAPEPMVDPNNYWVQFGADDLRSLSLESLADAHRLGAVGDQTMVQAPGSNEWVPLAVIIANFASGSAQSVAPSSAQYVSAAPMQQPSYQSAPPSAAPEAPAPSFAPSTPMASAPSASLPSASVPAVSAPNTLAPTAASVAAPLSGVSSSAELPLGLDDFEMPAFQNSRSVWIKRSLMGVGALVVVFGIIQLSGGEGAETTAQPVGAATPTTPVTTPPQVEAESSAWEKEKALLEEARRKDEEALAKAASSQEASAFGASLAGEPKAKATSPSSKRYKAPTKSKKSSKPAKADQRQFDPMNGAL